MVVLRRETSGNRDVIFLCEVRWVAGHAEPGRGAVVRAFASGLGASSLPLLSDLLQILGSMAVLGVSVETSSSSSQVVLLDL